LAPGVDPVWCEVMRHALLAITEEMGATLRCAAYPTTIKTRGDFSCAFFDRQLRTMLKSQPLPLIRPSASWVRSSVRCSGRRSPVRVRLVVHATTVATNALIEGKTPVLA